MASLLLLYRFYVAMNNSISHNYMKAIYSQTFTKTSSSSCDFETKANVLNSSSSVYPKTKQENIHVRDCEL